MKKNAMLKIAAILLVAVLSPKIRGLSAIVKKVWYVPGIVYGVLYAVPLMLFSAESFL